MRYVMRQKVFAFGDDFIIKDESGADRYHVDGKVFTIRKTLAIQDLAGNELAKIQKKLLSFGNSYEVYHGGQLAAVVSKRLFTIFKCKFVVDVPGPDDLEARGNFLEHEYEFFRGNRKVATCSKKWFSWSDTYGIDIDAGEDDVLILASSVVIDMVCHDDEVGH